jgi:hypothetical protein
MGDTQTAMATVQASMRPTPPTACDDNFIVAEVSVATLNVIGNDSDVDG